MVEILRADEKPRILYLWHFLDAGAVSYRREKDVEACARGGHDLRVAKVEAIPVSYPEPNDFNVLRHLIFCKITDEEGRTGWGEAVTQFPEASLATKAVIEGMSELVVGRDALHNDAIFRSIVDHAWWYGYGGGLASFAIAAIDIALWDLKGKQLECSVLDLLGGPVHERLPAIASFHAHHASIPAMAEEALGWLATGLQGIKVGFGKRGDAHLGYEHARDVEYVKTMREAIGAEKMFMIDLGINNKWDVATAVKRVQAFDEFDIDWIEEPLGAWDPSGYADLRAKTRCLIAYGEKEWDVDGFTRVLATGTCDVIGCDPGRAQGITGFKRVTDLVERQHRQANAHAWSSAIVTAASLAISFSSSACKLFEIKPLENPMQHELVTEPFAHVEGWVYPPEGPGLGIDVIDEVVERYRSDKHIDRA